MCQPPGRQFCPGAALTVAPMRSALVVASLAAGLSLRETAHKRVAVGELLNAARQYGVQDLVQDPELRTGAMDR